MTSHDLFELAQKARNHAHEMRTKRASEFWTPEDWRLVQAMDARAVELEAQARRERVKERLFFWRKAG